ncbi:Vacuolar iron transporter cccA [Zalerion maritima]|uniref:Vacuolar iron transporter cccA n=1 Tax=Zalerion maritima TaxID=339359 RepID=A0AAD5RMT3_9PEZI|nr:Vacuolar iron transporter cccA [Zalerion maritima]
MPAQPSTSFTMLPSRARFLADLTLGFADGLTVPFALSAGLSSLGKTETIIYAGLAEICAGCISMGIGGYLSARGEASEAADGRNESKGNGGAWRWRQRDPGAGGDEIALEDGLPMSNRNGGDALDDDDDDDDDDETGLLEKDEEGSGLAGSVEEYVEPLDLPPRLRREVLLHATRDPEILQLISRVRNSTAGPVSPTLTGLLIALGYATGGIIPLLPYFFAPHVREALIWSSFSCILALLAFGFGKRASGKRSPGWLLSATWEGIRMAGLGGLAAAAAVTFDYPPVAFIAMSGTCGPSSHEDDTSIRPGLRLGLYRTLTIDSSALDIRLFILHPAENHGDPVHGTLIKSCLPRSGAEACAGSDSISRETEEAESIPYYAVSYLWGDAGRTAAIWIDDVEFQVTKSLEWALRRIRREPSYLDGPVRRPEGIPVWADAVCINQQDLDERSQQVSKVMASIYKRAAKVICCPGLPDHVDGDVLLEWLRQEPNVPSGNEPTVEKWMEQWRKEGKSFYCFPKPHSHYNRSLGPLLESTYWSRAWVTQEVAMAEDGDVLADNGVLPIEALEDVCRRETCRYADTRPETSYHYPATRLATIMKARSLYRKAMCSTHRDGHDVTPGQLFPVITMMDATDPRDNFYGLYGMMVDLFGRRGGPMAALLRQVQPDYHAKTEADVFLDLTRVMMLGKNLSGPIFDCAIAARQPGWVDKPPPKDFPSWVPYWRKWNPKMINVESMMSENTEFFKTEGTLEKRLQSLRYTIQPEGKTIAVRGVAFDRVSETREIDGMGKIFATEKGYLIAKYTADHPAHPPQNLQKDDLVCVIEGYCLPMVLRPARHFEMYGFTIVSGYSIVDNVMEISPTGDAVGFQHAADWYHDNYVPWPAPEDEKAFCIV